MSDVFKQYSANKHDAVLLRFAGAYQCEDSQTVDAVEIVVRGRHKEIDFGTSKLADDTSFKVTTVLSYYKLAINGSPIIEIDCVNFINKVNDVDLLADVRHAIGL